MTTDSGWDNEMKTADVGHTFTDITPLGGHQHGYCDVYRARRHGKWHVLKALKPQYRDTPACQAMLRKEFDIGFQLSHVGIAATLGLEDVDSLGQCIIEEWVDGVRLDQFIAREDYTAAKARDIIVQLCEVLKYIHAHQVIHRDLKPSNILITADGDRVKVIDFGVSDTASHTIFKGPAGTQDFTAPELLAGQAADSRADLYSLGIIIRLINSHLPRADRQLSKFAQWCSMADRDQRPAGANQVLDALQRPTKSLRYIFIAAGIFATLLIATAIAMVIKFGQPKQETPANAPADDTTAVIDTIVDTTLVDTTRANATEVSTTDGTNDRAETGSQSAQPSQPAQEPAQKETTDKLSPLVRQKFMAKAASVGMLEAIGYKDELDETLRLQGKDAFDNDITEFLKDRIEGRLVHEANNMFINDLGHNKAMREFLLTPEGKRMLSAGRKVAFEYAQDRLHQLYPDLDIPPFPYNKTEWFD
ncbi:MAG: protein kinase [Muribaculaceae bacterium]|nr:protein kinase [Muribaculaceae bacterium]